MVSGAEGGAGAGSRPTLSRRALLAGAGVALGAAGCGGSSRGGSSAPASSSGGQERTDDVEILDGALGIEQRAIDAYTAAIPRLHGADAALARRVLAHEHAHAAALASLVREFGATPAPAGGSPSPLPPLHTRSAALGFLAGVENVAIAYYADAMPKLSGPFRHVMLGVAASEAEHLSALRMSLGLPGAAQAFVWGRP